MLVDLETLFFRASNTKATTMTKEQTEKQMPSAISSHKLGQEGVVCLPKPDILLLFLTFHSQNPLSFLTLKGSPAPAGKLAAFCSGTCC